MNAQLVVEYLKKTVLKLRLKGIDESDVAVANLDFNAAKKKNWFEVYANVGTAVAETERSTVAQILGTVVICVRRGEGSERADAIASAICDAFAPYNLHREQGFKQIESVVGNFDVKKRVVCRVQDVKATPGATFDGVYKTSVFVAFECEEEAI